MQRPSVSQDVKHHLVFIRDTLPSKINAAEVTVASGFNHNGTQRNRRTLKSTSEAEAIGAAKATGFTGALI